MSLVEPVRSENVKRDFLYELQHTIFSQSTFELLALFRLRVVNKQWRSCITARMIADAIQREVPMLVGLQLDKPIDFYVDIVGSYYAKCSIPYMLVYFHVGEYASKNISSCLNYVRSEHNRPTVWAHLFSQQFWEVLNTREGRDYVLASILVWREEAIRADSSVLFYHGAIDFLDNLERIVRGAYVVIGRRVTTGAVGFRGARDVLSTPMYEKSDFL